MEHAKTSATWGAEEVTGGAAEPTQNWGVSVAVDHARGARSWGSGSTPVVAAQETGAPRSHAGHVAASPRAVETALAAPKEVGAPNAAMSVEQDSAVLALARRSEVGRNWISDMGEGGEEGGPGATPGKVRQRVEWVEQLAAQRYAAFAPWLWKGS